MSDIADTTTVSTSISSATDTKAIESQAEADVLETKKSDAEGKISNAKSEVTEGEKNKAEIEDKLAEPPPQEDSGDKKGGGSSNAVDTSEKDKLQANLQVEDSKIQQAATEVQAAHVDLADLESALSTIQIDKAPVK